MGQANEDYQTGSLGLTSSLVLSNYASRENNPRNELETRQTVVMSSCLLLTLAAFGIGIWARRRPSTDTQQDKIDGIPIELDDPPWKQRFERPWS
jgi:hypothetical protein